jgi:integrase/recombinase XerD
VFTPIALASREKWATAVRARGKYRTMIFDGHGRRKYLTPAERRRFIKACEMLPLAQQTFCLILAYTGCRPSEALELQKGRVDEEMRAVVIRSLKKRQDRAIYRAIPLPDEVLAKLRTHSADLDPGDRLWPWCRTTAWSVVKSVMSVLGLSGVHACPKGLRHSFGVAAIQAGVSLNLVQRWLGHESIETTAIYTNVVGNEERAIATRLWDELTFNSE